MRFIIDSFRYNEWIKAYPDAVIVTLSEMPSSPTSEDIVYAHLTDFMENVAQADFPHLDEGSERIKKFREALIFLAQSRAAPMLIFYGGDQLTAADEAEVKKQVNSISLPGYSSDRIEVFRDAISRKVEASELREWAEKSERDIKSAAGRDPSSDIAHSFCVGSSSGEAALALRLLCEAWILVNWKSSEHCSCIKEVRNALGMKDDKPILPTDILIHAPITRANWLTPFGFSNGEKFSEALSDYESQKAVRKFFEEFTEAPTFQQVANLYLAVAQSVSRRH